MSQPLLVQRWFRALCTKWYWTAAWACSTTACKVMGQNVWRAWNVVHDKQIKPTPNTRKYVDTLLFPCFLLNLSKCSFLSGERTALVLLCGWASAAKATFTLISFAVTSNFESLPSGRTDRGRSCAAAAGAGCSPSRYRPAWCPARCGGWASPSWPGWGLATCPWAWAPAARGGSTGRAASGLWSCPCTCGNRWTTWKRLASCSGESRRGEGDERLNSLTEEEEEVKEPLGQQGERRSKFSRGHLTFSGEMWCAACTGRPPPPPRWWWKHPRRWWWRWPGCDSRCCLRPLIYLEGREMPGKDSCFANLLTCCI